MDCEKHTSTQNTEKYDFYLAHTFLIFPIVSIQKKYKQIKKSAFSFIFFNLQEPGEELIKKRVWEISIL